MAKYDKNGYITELERDEIFVFGSNGHGAHLGGAAATAVHKFGAKMGQAEGLQGQSYAIDTMDSEDEMFAQIKRFIQFAEKHENLKFYLTEIGCGIAGYSPEQIAPKFAYYWGNNIILPDSFNKANNKLIKDLFSGKKTILFFEHAEPGAMGGNLGGAIFWYLDKDGSLKHWQTFRTDEFCQDYNDRRNDFAYIYAGVGNYAHFNKETTYLREESATDFVLEYKGKEYTISGHCVGVAKEITSSIKPNTKMSEFEQKGTPPKFITQKEIEERKKRIAEIRKMIEEKKNKEK